MFVLILCLFLIIEMQQHKLERGIWNDVAGIKGYFLSSMHFTLTLSGEL